MDRVIEVSYKMNIGYKLVLIIFLLIVSGAATAMRCGQKLVYEEDLKYEVRQKCGEPLDKYFQEDKLPIFNRWGHFIGTTVRITEVWVYQRSPQEFLYEVVFDNGKVQEIRAKRSP